ncbi:MAG: hypothetical protein COU35_01395 [Candidatus Magasanikbacteria bacterium CG10_big_fil_rev_8_21_14_0_10_47_10]|uniref:histidine kinase n=1 Tax=Candidatus Magasanikbacteria bacterium CG10_big_fil_rev_8_21_14_0_10_47_10 TaxID=1974652 RepID=A0A2H0TSX1_9BACT|nr:MAG: hypothetical protein COU35_01395 [Candidatus Magasanikbacteria bacterium CG10_big_fil_rev_8_21_14_0_10_47_10]
MEIITNLDLFSVGITVAAIGVLGFGVYVSNKNNDTNKAFLFFALMTILYGIVNYIYYHFKDPQFTIWFLRFTIFAAVWHSLSFYLLFRVFPDRKLHLHKWEAMYLLPWTLFVSMLTLTPFVFPAIDVLGGEGEASVATIGPMVPVFGMTTLFLVVSALVVLFKKTRDASKGQKKKYQTVLLGATFSLLLILIYNMILPLTFLYVRFIPLAAVFFFPFIFLTAYAIMRHRLFNAKLISTEILTFILAIVSFSEVILANTRLAVVYRSTVFILVLLFGLLLIKNVFKEIEERKKVSRLADSLEKANEKLKELDQLKTEFISIASHQLRTPLSIIKGYGELMVDGAYGPVTKQMKHILGNMDESNEHLIKLVDEFLNISRIEQGRTQFTFEPFNINDVIKNVVTELQQIANKKNIIIDIKAGKLPQVTADGDKIRHCIYNFVDNAIKYSPDGSHVLVSAFSSIAGVTVSVKDSGAGLDKKDIENLFSKFYRSPHVMRDVQGTGLGLYVVRQFVVAHGGRAWAKSKGIGKGSEFIFFVPLAPSKRALTEAEKAKKRVGKGGKPELPSARK